MKLSILSHLVWGLVAVAAFAAGYFATGRSTSPPSLVLAPATLTAPSAQTVDAVRVDRPPAAEEPSTLPSDQARARAFEILAIPNRLERMRRLAQLIAQVDTQNWREIVEGCTRQTTSELRLNRNELELIFARIGEVAGATAITEALASPNRDDQTRVAVLLTGWAAADPNAAAAWFQTQPSEWQKGNLRPFIGGLSQMEPIKAMQFALLEANTVQQQGLVSNIVDNAIQLWGFREAERLFTPLMGGPDSEENPKGRIFAALADRRIAVSRLGNNATDTLDWLDKYAYPTSPVGPMAMNRLMENAARSDPIATINLVDERRDRLRHTQAAYETAAAALLAHNPAQFAAWIDGHPDHPEHDRVIGKWSHAIWHSGLKTEVKRWANDISDPQIRAQTETAIRNVEKAYQPSSASPLR